MIEINKFEANNPNYKEFLIGSGSTANCYKISDDKVCKVFMEPISEKWYENIYRNLLYLEGLSFNNIVFPQEIIADNSSDPQKYMDI